MTSGNHVQNGSLFGGGSKVIKTKFNVDSPAIRKVFHEENVLQVQEKDTIQLA